MLNWFKKIVIKKTEKIQIGDIVVDVVFKNIRNIHLRVLSPSGKVQLTSPARISLDTLRLFANSKIAWIKKHQQKILYQTRHSFKNYENEETHYFLGKKYSLNVIGTKSKPKVNLNEDCMDIYIRPNSSKSQCKKLLDGWYRDRLKEIIPELIGKWEGVMDVQVDEFGIKKMKTRWGTCNIRARRIWINLELAKKPINCLELIVVHEMVHLLERGHNKRFKSLMDKFLPDWKNYQHELNNFPMKHGKWEY